MSLPSSDLDALDADLVARIRRLRLVAFDFDGVFTDNLVYVLQGGTEAVRCSRADGLGLRMLERLGIEPLILSTETNPLVVERASKLKIGCFPACEDKADVLQRILSERGLTHDQVAFVGNDVNDLTCLTTVGLAIVVHDAHADVLPVAHYRTRTAGGHGAVREVCDLIYKVRMAGAANE